MSIREPLTKIFVLVKAFKISLPITKVVSIYRLQCICTRLRRLGRNCIDLHLTFECETTLLLANNIIPFRSNQSGVFTKGLSLLLLSMYLPKIV